MLEQLHKGALVQNFPQFFQGGNTRVARPLQYFFPPIPSTKPSPKMFSLLFFSSSLTSTQPKKILVFNTPPLIIYVGNAIIFQTEKEKKSRKKKTNNKETREERQKVTSCNMLLKQPPTLPISNQFLMFSLQGLPLKRKNGFIPACQIHLQTW